MSNFPPMFRVRQLRERPRIEDVAGTVDSELSKLDLGSKIKPGESVAITAGSRGVANIPVIIKAIADHLKKHGAEPFVVPAMGSHGGGTAEGQRKIVESYGMSEEFVGCPIRSSMETVIVTETKEGIPVHFDRFAHEADHVVVCGRVKPHTCFTGEIESGLLKMMLIGLGKHAGAAVYHRAIQNYSFDQIVRSVAGNVLSKCGILAGLAVVENAYDETAKVAAVAPVDFVEREKELLVDAKKWMPRLPFMKVDLLIVDEVGKNISGSSMDTNVSGRKYPEGVEVADPNYPQVTRIIVRGLCQQTHGNAAGIGQAEFITTRALNEINVETTRINCLTGGGPSGARLPLNYDTDRELLEVALPTIGLIEPPDARVTWIRNTLQVVECECSAAYWDEAQQRDDLEVLSELRPFAFDAEGNFVPFEPELAAH